MSQAQGGILSEASSHALFLVARFMDGVDTGAVVKACAALEDQAADLSEHHEGTAIGVAVSFGAAFWRHVHTPASPAELKAFKPLGEGSLSAPATHGDLLLHLHSERQDLIYELLNGFMQAVGDELEVMDEVAGFRYLEARDLTGFIDGTENPEGEERAGVGLIGDEDPGFAGGSYVLCQRFVHQLKGWRKLSDAEQEGIIGRTKPDSVELDDAVRPDTAHISRVVIEEDGEELEILRHSMPYGQVSGESGLLFIAYSRHQSIFEKMLANMYGASGDGLHDHLMDHTRAVSGGYFFAPSRDMLLALAGG